MAKKELEKTKAEDKQPKKSEDKVLATGLSFPKGSLHLVGDISPQQKFIAIIKEVQSLATDMQSSIDAYNNQAQAIVELDKAMVSLSKEMVVLKKNQLEILETKKPWFVKLGSKLIKWGQLSESQ